MIPASRYGAAARDASFSCATNAPSDPNSSTSNTGHTAMSNHRFGLRHNTYQCRRTTVRTRSQLMSLVHFHVAARELQEDGLEVAVPEHRGDVAGRAVGDDASAGDEHDALAHALHLEHVVARDEQGGAFVGADVEQSRPDAHRDIGIERRG